MTAVDKSQLIENRQAPPKNTPRAVAIRIVLSKPVVVTVLLVAFLAMALSSAARKCNTFDEVTFLAAGCSYWLYDDYRLCPEVGNLGVRWFALPVVLGKYQFPAKDHLQWQKSRALMLGQYFLFESGNDPETMLFRARIMSALLGVALCVIVYCWSRRLFGDAGGVLSVILCVFSPSILAHTRLLAVDLPVTLFFVLFVWRLWIVLHRITLANLLFSCLAAAGLALSKMSGLLGVPIGLALIAIRLFSRQPLEIAIGRVRCLRSQARQLIAFAVLTLIHVVVCVVFIWGLHGFRYDAMKDRVEGRDRLYESWESVLTDSGVIGSTVAFARDKRLLPEAYLYGFLYAYKHSGARVAFLNGQYGLRSWESFFPYCLLLKTPLPLFLLLALAAAAAASRWRNKQPEHKPASVKSFLQSLYPTAPLWVLLAVYWLVAINIEQNTGHRHILPTYPPMFILAGAAGWWMKGRARAMKAVAAAAVVTFAVASLQIWPHYLAYFNLLAGGPKNGYRHLVDSSLDWGQDLPGLKRWLDRHGYGDPTKPPAYLSYFGTSSTKYYKIQAALLPSNPPWEPREFVFELKSGAYCISATTLQLGIPPTWRWLPDDERDYRRLLRLTKRYAEADKRLLARHGLILGKPASYWNEMLWEFDKLRLARLTAFFRGRQPDDYVGYSILIYRLTDEDIKRALYGPPPGATRDTAAARPSSQPERSK